MPGLVLSSDTGTSDLHWFSGDAAPEEAQLFQELPGQAGAASLGQWIARGISPWVLCAARALGAGWGGWQCLCTAGEAKGSFFPRYLEVPSGLPGHGVPRRRR